MTDIKTTLLTYLSDFQLSAIGKGQFESSITDSVCQSIRDDAGDLCESKEKFVAALHDMLDASTDAARYYATKDNCERDVSEFKTHSRIYSALLNGLDAFLNPPADIHEAERQ